MTSRSIRVTRPAQYKLRPTSKFHFQIYQRQTEGGSQQPVVA